eukprot:247099-Rhodomonas_salina.1
MSLMWGLISAISLPIGAFIGLYKKPPAKVSATMMSFGAGALLFALSIELFGRTIAQKEHFEHEAEYNKVGEPPLSQRIPPVST